MCRRSESPLTAISYPKPEPCSSSHHYASYHFLVEAQSESSDGLEHHQSSDDQVPELGMVSPSFSAEAGNLLAHEMIHSWNGKFRRPAGLATA